jgi:PDZ domain-containing protein
LAVGLVVALAATMVIHVPYVIISPGDATALNDQVVTIAGAPTFGHRGQLLYLTVQVSSEDPTLLRYLTAGLDHDVDVEPKADVIGGCATYEENARLNDELMSESQDAAKTVALRRLGYPVVEESSEAVVLDVSCTGPSRGLLMLGDVITAVDGSPVSKADEVGPLVRAHRPGDVVRITVKRGNATQDVTVTLGTKDGAAFLGIATRTMTTERFPFTVSIDTQRVSGPSAGLAFALAIVDDLTPGDLTGGRRVAVTGAIDTQGTVSPVGGVAQKTVAARQNGAKLMLVPPGEAKTARAHADGMRIVTVHTLDEALAALQRAGGAAVPAAPSAGVGAPAQ